MQLPTGLLLTLAAALCAQSVDPATQSDGKLTTVRVINGVYAERLTKFAASSIETIAFKRPLPVIPATEFLKHTGDIAQDINRRLFFTTAETTLFNSTMANVISLLKMGRNSLESGTRSKRGWQALGNLADWCCNIATHKNLAPLQKDVQQLASTLSLISSSQSVAQDNLRTTIGQFRNFSSNVQKSQHDLALSFHSFRQSFAGNLAKEELTTKTILHLIYLTNTLSEMIMEETILQAIVAQCNQHHLSPQLIDPETLTSRVNLLLSKPEYHAFELAIPDVTSIYSNKLTHCIVTETDINVYVKLPLRKIGENYEIKNYWALPFVHKGHICRAFDRPSVLVAVSDTEIIPLTGLAEQQCRGDAICEIPRFHESFSRNVLCLNALLTLRTVEDAAPHCRFHCELSETPAVVQIKLDEFIVANPTSHPLEVTCGKQISKQSPGVNGAHRLFIPGNCSLRLNSKLLIRTREVMAKHSATRHRAEVILPAFWTDLTFELKPLQDISSAPAMIRDDKLINDSWTDNIQTIFTDPEKINIVKIPTLSSKVGKSYNYFPLENEALIATLLLLIVVSVIHSLVLVIVFIRLNYRPTNSANEYQAPAHESPVPASRSYTVAAERERGPYPQSLTVSPVPQPRGRSSRPIRPARSSVIIRELTPSPPPEPYWQNHPRVRNPTYQNNR